MTQQTLYLNHQQIYQMFLGRGEMFRKWASDHGFSPVSVEAFLSDEQVHLDDLQDVKASGQLLIPALIQVEYDQGENRSADEHIRLHLIVQNVEGIPLALQEHSLRHQPSQVPIHFHFVPCLPHVRDCDIHYRGNTTETANPLKENADEQS